MNISELLNTPGALKAMDLPQLEELCADIRAFLIENVSQSGGHLASNLGAVELTVALHRVYDVSRDRLVFDVGHQCYTHKLLTGRLEGFKKDFRGLGGMSGFPKPCESDCDAFIAGHASNAVSVALGMARARTLLGADYNVAALMGDGALTGGLAYEGLSDAGESGEPLVVILNDNAMSINLNVGGMSRLLSHLRVRPGYLDFKRAYRRVFKKCPPLYNFNHRLKEAVKGVLLRDNVFDDFGFNYLGPVDGHDLEALESVLSWARDSGQPTLVHVLTQKGRGYAPAEDNPDLYHGVGKFDPQTGITAPSAPSFSSEFGRALTELAVTDGSIAAVTAAMSEGTGLDTFAAAYPERFFDVGIAEGHAVTMAAGMAKQGLRPVAAIYSTFLQRCFDMLIHDVALQKLHVVLAVDRAGIVGKDGETHQGAFDLAMLSAVPGMTVLAPSSFGELRAMLKMALYDVPGPVAVRYPRGGEGEYKSESISAPCVRLREGSDLTIVSYGILINQALAAAAALAERGVSAEVLKLNLLAPIDVKAVLLSIKKTGRLLAAEDVCADGCAGARILCRCAAEGVAVSASRLINLGGGILTHGSPEELLALRGLDAAGIERAALAMLGKAEDGNG